MNVHYAVSPAPFFNTPPTTLSAPPQKVAENGIKAIREWFAQHGSRGSFAASSSVHYKRAYYDPKYE